MKNFIKHLQINPATVALVLANLLMLVTLVAISRNLDQREKVTLMVEQSAKDVQLVKEINYLYLQQITELSLLHSFAQSPVEQQIEPLHRDILAKLNALKQFNAEDAESMQIYDRLELLFIDLFNRTNEMLEIKRSKGIPAATKFIKNSNIYDLHNQISNELSRIKKNEDIDLTNDQQNFFLKRHETRRNLTFSVAAEIVLLVLCFVVLRQKFKIQQAAENLEKARVQILETLIQESSLEMTLIKIAQIVEAQNPDILVSILLLKDNQLFTAAAPSLPDFYKEAINGLEIGMGVGSCGTAAFTGNRTIVENLQTHPYWQKFRSVTKRANLNSCWSEPIFNYAGNVLGTFAIYHRYPCKPKNDDILLIEQVSRLIGIAIEKKQILEALQQSEERFQATIDILPIPVLLHDEMGKIKFLNPVFTQTFGYQLEDIPSLALWQTKTELENDSEEADFSKHNANEFIIRCLDGSKKTLLQTSSKIPPFCLQTFFDITERKKVEQLLADTNVQLMTLVEAIPDAILFKDSAGRWLIINESTKKLLALENIDWKNKTDFELAQLQPEFKATYINCHENDKAVWENKSSVLFAEQMLSKTGGFLNLEVRKVPIFAEDGERQALLVIIRDVTERTLFEEELRHSKLEAEQANQAKSNFLANMSHEIRTPLNAVINFSYLASQTPLQPKQKDYIDKITLSGKNLLAIINDILDISKIEAGKLEIENAPFDLFSIIAQISAIIESRIADKQNPLKLHCNIDVPQYLIGDALRLNQVLLNLLTNAVKFTESGEITLTAKVLSQTPNQVYLQFSVQDSGIGMSQETMGNLFQPFTQADSSTSRRYGGTGLGLNICKRLVEMMGGKISVTSTANKGSCFTFTIPLTVCQSSDIPLIEKENASSLANFKVLLVDDEKNEREITAELLQKFGVNVELAGSGEEAIELLKQNNVYDGIFLDWKMAKMDGVETAQRIISEIDAAYKDKIIIITAYDNKLLRSQLQKLSIHRFVSKPVDVSNLFNAVISLANNKNASITANSQTHQALQEVSHLQPTRILLVEDNEINQEIVKELLIDYDLMIDIAENGIQAVEKVKNNTYQLVFMDLQMPEMDGFQATQIIRTELGKTDLPIVAMTAHAMKSEVDKCFAAGMNDHLSKPINPEEVYACLLKWLTVENVAKPVLTNVKPEKFDGLKTILNAEKGLFHVNQNQTLYQQLLTNFFNEQSLLLDNLPEDKDALTRKVHTLKSLSASLGMEELSQCAAQVEQSLMESVEIEQTLLSQLSEKLQNVLAVLKVWLDENALPVETVEKSEFDKQQAIELLEGISKNLKQDLGLATKMVGQLKPMLCENADFKTDFTSLEKSLGKFDIKNALKMTEQLISQLQSDVTQ